MGIRILIFLLFLNCFKAHSQIKTEVNVSAIYDENIRRNMENSMVAIIDEINESYRNNSNPKNPSSQHISQSAFSRLLSLWAVSPFKITQPQLIKDGLHLTNGNYQVRNIPIYIRGEANENQEREIAFSFDGKGVMVDCFLCLEKNTYSSLVMTGNSVTELRRREIILDLVERFRTAYNIKDIDFINKIFSNEALIIVGKIYQEYYQTSDKAIAINGLSNEKVRYHSMSKGEYLRNLSKAFRSNEYVKVEFDSIEIVQSLQYKDIYGVTLWQSWNSANYRDQGWLFLMVDFRNPDSPLINVRTWQPGILNGSHFPRSGVFHLGSFNIEGD